ncbi:histidinol-phosphate transaminase [Shewanella intestini]|uniref:Histidinol-phosphate aminotransferase n=1 Tax=Shewanella intestini TaxID=2017544 RepID=A0ABS5HZ60_9GAMM|nr:MULTISPECIES: histidinol-phosphate transaminase [Shewanella]MBR9727080.1 histidinol-phosphate transaminase [Shewanella intestini]MRG35882.1 histidinol-phosphate transaminase [Shewanella sp. XMDDZSB0408]
MTFNANKLARPELLTLTPYQSARRIGGQGDIWINANESPYNNSELDGLNRYPECQPPALIAAYSRYSQVKQSRIVTCRGADEAIELLIRTFCEPGKDTIATFGPTYGMYAISAGTFNIGVNEIQLTDDYQLPHGWQDKAQAAKLVFICNPNNPTGSIIDKSQLAAAVASMPETLVVIDEAYIEFSPQYTSTDLLERYPNVVILRTLSKAFALAGARCGFLLANEAVIDLVMRVIAPYPVPLPVAQVATNALSQSNIALMQQQVSELNVQGQKLTTALTAIGATSVTPFGNFVLAHFSDVAAVQTKLAKNGIVARAYKDTRLANAIRFSFTNAAQTQTLITALSS